MLLWSHRGTPWIRVLICGARVGPLVGPQVSVWRFRARSKEQPLEENGRATCCLDLALQSGDARGRAAKGNPAPGGPDSGLPSVISRNGPFFPLCIKNMSNLPKIITDRVCPPAALLGVETVEFRVVSASRPAAFIMGGLFWVRSEEQFTRFKDRHGPVCSPGPSIQKLLCPPPAREAMINYSPPAIGSPIGRSVRWGGRRAGAAEAGVGLG